MERRCPFRYSVTILIYKLNIITLIVKQHFHMHRIIQFQIIINFIGGLFLMFILLFPNMSLLYYKVF